MIDFIIRFYLEIKLQIKFFFRYLLNYYNYRKIKNLKDFNIDPLDKYNWTFFFFKRTNINEYKVKLLGKKHTKIVKLLSFKSKFEFVDIDRDIYKFLKDRNFTRLEFYFLRNKFKYGKNFSNKTQQGRIVRKKIRKLMKSFKSISIDAFLNNKTKFNIPATLFGFIFRQYLSIIFFIFYVIIILFLFILFIRLLYNTHFFEFFTSKYIQDITVYNHMDGFFNKFNIDLNSHKLKNVDNFNKINKFLIKKNFYAFFDRGPLKFDLKKNIGYYKIQYTKMFSQAPYTFQNIEINYFVNDIFKKYTWFLITEKNQYKFFEHLNYKIKENPHYFYPGFVPSISQKDASLFGLSVNSKNKMVDYVIYNIDEYPTKNSKNKDDFCIKQLLEKKKIIFTTPYVPSVHVKKSFMFAPYINKEYKYQLASEMQYENYKKFNFKLKHKDNYFVREYLNKLKENYSKTIFKYDFLQDSILIDSFLSSNVQQKITVMEKLCNKQFSTVYRIFLFKESYFESFVNLFKFFFDSRIKARWKGTYYSKNPQIFYYHLRYKSYNKYLQYKYLLFLDLYSLYKNHNNYFYNLIDNNIEINYRNYLLSCKNPLILKDKDNFLESLVDFSLSAKVDNCFDYPERTKKYSSGLRYVSSHSEKNLKRLFIGLYEYFTEPSFIGKRKDKLFYFFKYNNFNEAQFPYDVKNMLEIFFDKNYLFQLSLSGFEIYKRKMNFISEIQDIESPRYGIYETLFSNPNLFYKTININYKIQVSEQLVKYHYNILYDFINKLDELRLLINNLNNKYDLFVSLKKKYNRPLFFEKYIINKINFEFFPYTYKTEELSSNVINKFLYKDYVNNQLFDLKYMQLNVKSNLIFNKVFFNFLLNLTFLVRDLKFEDLNKNFLYNYKDFFRYFFFEKQIRNEKIDFMLINHYFKNQIFTMFNNETIFFENYNYATDNNFEAGRFFVNKYRSKKINTENEDRFDVSIFNTYDASKKIANLIFTQNTANTEVLLQTKYNYTNKEKQIIEFKDEKYKKSLVRLFYWLCGSFSTLTAENIQFIYWFLNNDVYYFDIFHWNYILYTKHVNLINDVEKYPLYDSYDYGTLAENSFSFIYNGFYGKNKISLNNNQLYKYAVNYYLNSNNSKKQISNLLHVYNNYIFDEKLIYSFDANDLPNLAVKIILTNYKDISFVSKNNVMSYDILEKYFDFPTKTKRSFIIEILKISFLDSKFWFISELYPKTLEKINISNIKA